MVKYRTHFELAKGVKICQPWIITCLVCCYRIHVSMDGHQHRPCAGREGHVGRREDSRRLELYHLQVLLVGLCYRSRQVQQFFFKIPE